MAVKEKSEAFWDNTARNYDKTEERFEYIHSKCRDNARKHLKESDIVLDFGCGTGTTACALSCEVKQIQAIDISSKMIELAKGKANSANIQNVSFSRGDVFDEKFEDGSFDAILAFNMLHTVSEPQSTMKRIHKLLKPGGLLVSATPCLRDRLSFLVGMQIKLVQVLCSIGVIPIPIRRLKSTDLDELMKKENLQIIDSDKLYAGASSYFVVAKKTRET